MKIMFALACLMTSYMQAESIRLFNDSVYDLRAVVRGADGSFLAEMLIRAQNSAIWHNTYGPYQSRVPIQQSRSQTPYVVVWYCLSGEQFSICDTVATGGVVEALSCLGTRTCKTRKKENTLQEEYQEM
ncbi:MAG: hypothetical protein LBC45_04955 [Chlamydiales bacterium]|jgi:hypothetical protein|nr:hypothetical protein [Chlamydiales bacterium]